MMKMFPSKAMEDYMAEMNRLFSRTSENEIQQPYASPYNQTMANRSSSSTDSTSPESFPEFYKKPETRYYSEPRTDWPQPMEPHMIPELSHDTPRPVQRQRPIVGRKILNDQLSPAQKTEQDLFDFGNIWQPDEAMFLEQTPPKVNNIFIEQKNYSQNVFYELFSPENRGFEFRTPVKTVSPITVTSNSISPLTPSTPNSRFANLSPVSSNFGFQQSPRQKYPSNSPNFRHNPRERNTDVIRPRNTEVTAQKMCTFCRKNGETPLVYMTHFVKERLGNKHIVTCPILRSHVCSTCRATGDDAHTITYCPVLRSSNNGAPLRSTTITLKNTRVMSNGKRRY